MGQLTLILGGVRSGKSIFAERLAARSPPVTYIATSLAGDAEMEARIEKHKERRPADWKTIDCTWHVRSAVQQNADAGCLLVDCVSLWVTNLMLGIAGRHKALADQEIMDRTDRLVDEAKRAQAKVILVSGEVGLGGIEANTLGRRFADLLGQVNQRLAAAADEAYLCVAGLSMKLK